MKPDEISLEFVTEQARKFVKDNGFHPRRIVGVFESHVGFGDMPDTSDMVEDFAMLYHLGEGFREMKPLMGDLTVTYMVIDAFIAELDNGEPIKDATPLDALVILKYDLRAQEHTALVYEIMRDGERVVDTAPHFDSRWNPESPTQTGGLLDALVAGYNGAEIES